MYLPIYLSIYLLHLSIHLVLVDRAGGLVGGGGQEPQLRAQAHHHQPVQGPDKSLTGNIDCEYNKKKMLSWLNPPKGSWGRSIWLCSYPFLNIKTNFDEIIR